MYSETIQSSPLVLFSSLPISSPFQFTSISIDHQLTQDSLICLLKDKTSIPIQPLYKSKNHKSNENESLKILGSNDKLYSLCSIVLHLQSPNCKSTFIKFPNENYEKLGIKLPFLHLQIKFINHHFLFEIEIQDEEIKNLLRLRFSTFQKKAKFYTKTSNQIPLLHIPIYQPNLMNKQTNWTELKIPIKSITERYSKFKFNSINWIKIHSNCRLRRIYFSIDGKTFESQMNQTGYDYKNDRMIVSGSNDHSHEKNKKSYNQRIELSLFKST